MAEQQQMFRNIIHVNYVKLFEWMDDQKSIPIVGNYNVDTRAKKKYIF